MRLGLQLGYWGAQPPHAAVPMIQEAESIGFDAVFTAESWGSDAFTPLAWWGSQTQRVRLGTAVVQLSARTAASTAMTALTMDHLSNGRHILGLGVSGPQVVEGWYGQPFAKPLQRTREYVGVIRKVLAREAAVINDGAQIRLPYDGPGATGLGKPLKSITHPLRADLPIWLGSEGPKNVAMTAEIADGWLAIYYAPRLAGMYDEWLDEGFAREGARRSRADFEVAAHCPVVITDDPATELAKLKPATAWYIGGMGAPGMNFHERVYRRMGYDSAVDEISSLFQAGKRAEAVAAVPDEMVAECAIVGNLEEVRAGIKRWEQAGVTMLLITVRDLDQLRLMAPLVEG
ncbi:LLM class F420-dependent oxidoreductase [Nocardia stercoris]|uniref:LLM class F420-dependent oxidoreductase n=1 Tax=Nocardia stercoris TaxID=2483361 RepID=A0A3M2KTI8_9NOCA|nr:LLM class F420-dependent oxidoreductase [Nocardia stercoris]RMI28254.1 LLM class F420-dependent oxidoreductase [Nocardia stercoris]